MRRRRWISATLFAALALAPAGSVVDAQVVTGDPQAARDRLAEVVRSARSTPAEREDAAGRLLAGNPSDTRYTLTLLLGDNGAPLGQAAVARALSQSPNPDPTLVPQLVALLGPNHLLTDAAAVALAAYRDREAARAAFDALSGFADNANNPDGVRADATRAMGGMVAKRVAAYLVAKVNADPSATVRDAAADALVDLTGLNDLRPAPGAWQAWWANHAPQTEDAWRAYLLDQQSRQYRLGRARQAQLAEDAYAVLVSGYYAVPDDRGKMKVLGAYLDARTPQMRVAAARLVTDDHGNRPMSDAVMQRLQAMIGDPDADVRVAVVNAFLAINDPKYGSALIAQLGVEQGLRVKLALAKALGKLKDPAAVPALLQMLQNAPQMEGATVAARTFAEIGATLRHDDPAVANRVSKQLRQVLDDRRGQPGSDELRAACTAALAALRDPASFITFFQMLDQPNAPEPRDVRLAALDGVGNLGDQRANETVARIMQDDRDWQVRLAAARAMQTVGTPDQLNLLYDKINAQNQGAEANAEVRAVEWQSLQRLLESGNDVGRLQDFANRFTNDPEKRLVVLKLLSRALSSAQRDKDVALNDQEIADTLMAFKPPRPADSVKYLQQAIDFWHAATRAGGGDDTRLEGLVGQMLDAQLAAHQYPAAARFAADQIRTDPYYQRVTGPKLRDAASQLAKDGSATDARALIDAILSMSPPLEDRFLHDVERTRDQLNNPAGTGQ